MLSISKQSRDKIVNVNFQHLETTNERHEQLFHTAMNYWDDHLDHWDMFCKWLQIPETPARRAVYPLPGWKGKGSRVHRAFWMLLHLYPCDFRHHHNQDCCPDDQPFYYSATAMGKIHGDYTLLFSRA